MNNFNQLTTLIFDLGGVIINLDLPLCINKLKQIGFTDVEHFLSNYGQKDFFLDYELGRINTEKFVEIITEINPAVEKTQIIDAWCAFLQDIPQRRIEILDKLKKTYRLLLLSNTNPLHFDVCATGELKKYGKTFDDFFETCYLSCRLGMSKPNKEIFEHILMDKNLKANECMLIDDGQKNIETAQSLGFQTFYITNENTLEDFFELVK
jgi:putative hydrolase of the HAD superfamily